jgi:hypothetical protein
MTAEELAATSILPSSGMLLLAQVVRLPKLFMNLVVVTMGMFDLGVKPLMVRTFLMSKSILMS